jgi:hypothetical protein
VLSEAGFAPLGGGALAGEKELHIDDDAAVARKANDVGKPIQRCNRQRQLCSTAGVASRPHTSLAGPRWRNNAARVALAMQGALDFAPQPKRAPAPPPSPCSRGAFLCLNSPTERLFLICSCRPW